MASFNHLTGNDKLGSGSYTAEAGDVTETFRYEPDETDAAPITEQMLADKLRDIYGYTSIYGDRADPPPIEGRLHRVNPLQHPFQRSLYATRVNVNPVHYRDPGYEGKVSDPGLDEKLPPNYAFWGAWDFAVTFSPRPYLVLDDSAITPQFNNVWWDEDGEPHSYVYWPEWLRNTETEPKPRPNDIVHWKGAVNNFRSSGTKPNGSTYSSRPYMRLPTHDLTVYWYGIPMRYLTSSNSYITRFVDHINQYPITLDDGTFGAGELLYVNYEYSKYTATLAPIDIEAERFGVLFLRSAGKLVNLKLNFIVTKARITDPPVALFDPGLGSPHMAANPNWIAAGHNLVPWHKTRKYYYVTSQGDVADDTTKWVPQFRSFPFELLFKDPDVGLMS